MKTPKPYYSKIQTKWTRYPAMLRSHRGDTTIAVAIHPEHRACDPPVEAATIYLTPHEAQGFAAWLSQQAEHVLAKSARSAARKAARLAKRIEEERS